MSIDHRRPLVAFIGVALLCAFVIVNGYVIVAAKSPMGGDLASARGLFSDFEGEQPQLMPEVVDGATVLDQPDSEVPSGTTVNAQVPAILAIREVAGATTPAAVGEGTVGATSVADTGAADGNGDGNRTGNRNDDDDRSGAADDPDRDGGRTGTGSTSGRTGTGGGSAGEPTTAPVDAGNPEPTRPGNGPRTDNPGQGHDAVKPGHGPRSGSTPPGHASAPARPAAPGHAKPPTPPKPEKQAKPAKPHGSSSHSSHGTPPGHAKAPKAPKAPQGKAKGHGKAAPGHAKAPRGHGRH